MAATIEAQNMYAYQSQALGERTLVAVAADGSGVQSLTNNVLYWDIGGNPITIFNPAVMASRVRMVDSRDWAYFADGVDYLKWNIAAGLSSWGIASPLTGPVLGASVGSGQITVLIGRVYYVAFFNSVSQSYTDISPASASTGPLTAQNQNLITLPVSTNPAVTSKIILATSDGGNPNTLYQIATIPNSQTTYLDTTSQAVLLASSIWQNTDTSGVIHGLFGNQPPPKGSYPTSHNGRIFMAVGEVLYYSKSLAEVTTSSGIIAGRYEEAWPPDNSINVATGAELIHGLLSDGQILYIGTEEHIFRLLGDSASNFSQPQIVFPQTGLMNQDTWQLVYIEGTPVGTMWVTPDLRVMASDFNTYDNVGTPVQKIMNTMNPSAATNSWAVMVSNGPYNFYMLAIPTGTNTEPDTFLVYDLRLRKWYVWQFADLFSSGIFYTNLAGIPRWVFCDSNGIIRLIDPTQVLDRATDAVPVPITSTLQTTWLDFDDSMMRKTLNEIEVETSIPATTAVTVLGGSTQAQLNTTPNTVVSGAPLTQSPFGLTGDYKVYLAGYSAIDRFYKINISSSSSATSTTNDVVLGAYSVESIPIHRY
jgi:hypothetical protein